MGGVVADKTIPHSSSCLVVHLRVNQSVITPNFKTITALHEQFSLSRNLETCLFNDDFALLPCTVRPLLSGHPQLSGHFPKSRIICK